MAHSLSAKKRIRQNEKSQMRNKSRKSVIKTQARKFLDAIRAKDVTVAEEQFRLLSKNLDQVASKGTIHKNQASRKKARMQKRLNMLKTSQ